MPTRYLSKHFAHICLKLYLPSWLLQTVCHTCPSLCVENVPFKRFSSYRKSVFSSLIPQPWENYCDRTPYLCPIWIFFNSTLQGEKVPSFSASPYNASSPGPVTWGNPVHLHSWLSLVHHSPGPCHLPCKPESGLISQNVTLWACPKLNSFCQSLAQITSLLLTSSLSTTSPDKIAIGE